MDEINQIDKAFAQSMKNNPFVKDAVIAMLKNDIEYCAKQAAHQATQGRAVDLLLGRLDQCNRILKRMELNYERSGN
jgi:hypothetical protein